MTSFSRQACPQTTSPLTKRTALVLALSGLLSLIGISNSHAVSFGGCGNYVPLNGDVVVCTPTVSPAAGQGVIAPERNTTNNNISVTIQAGTFLDINGSNIGLGSGSTVINDGRLNTQRFTNGYGISAGVNGRSQLGGNSITNNGDITTAGSNAHGIFISAAAITNGANNTIINSGLIQTSGTGDGIRLFTTARGVTNQITNSGLIETKAKVPGIRLRSTESIDTISNTGIITMSGVDAVGILVLNTLNRPTVSNTGTITTTGPEGHAIYGEGAMALINSGTLTSDVYAIYFQTGTSSAGSNSVTLKAGSNITGGLRFNPSKTSETLVFDGFVDANFDNNLLNVNNISAIQSADVTMNAASYSFGASEINVDQTSQLTISAPIGDAAIATSMTKLGAGVLTLSGQSTYTGTTTINAGILRVGAPNALPTNTAVNINAGTLALNNVSQTIGSLAGAGAVTLGTGTLTTGGNGSNTSYSGIISGTGGLVKLGSGTLSLSGANTYSGGTLLSQGVLVLAKNNALGTGSLQTAQDTTLRAGKADLTLANSVVVQGDTTIDTAGELVLLTGTVSGTGKLIKVGAGTLELAGVNSYSGGTQIEQGILALDVNGAASTGEVVMAAGTTIQADATLLLDNLIKLRGEVEVNTQSFDLTLNNAVTNNSVGVLVKTGSGMLTLNGVNTYTGGTTLVEGTLALYGRLASGVQIGSGTLLAGTGTINGDVVNRGIIQPRLNGSRSTLTIIGNYSGENAIFASKLGGTAPNAIVADQLAIVGAGSVASGSSTIVVSDPIGVLGQPTTGDGILLVGFSDGATGTDTAFRSDRIAAGAYEYQVVRGGQSSAQDWYLRADNNTPVPPKPVTPQTAQREEVALYPILPSLARQYLMSITGTLDDRRGAPDSLPKERVAWARVIAQNNQTHPPNVNDGPDLKANDWGLQIGADVVRAEIDAGHWRMGPVITIGRSTGQAYNNSGSLNTGSVSLNGYSLGLNVTLAMDNGAYLDVLVQGTRLTGVSANSPLGTSIQTTGWGLSGSVEGGWRLGLSDTVSLTPQAQLYGVHTQLADSGDLYSRIEMPNASMLVGRVGLKISYDSKPIQGPKTQLWARVSALSTLSGRDASTSFLNVAGKNPTVFQSQAPATWMSLDAGVTVNAAPNTQINIGLGYQTSFNGQFTGISGQINARVGF